MIFDRTQEDINKAASVREEYVKKFTELTTEQIETLERGMMTVNTLNRIEQKQSELKELFNSMGYWNTPIENKTDWQIADVFNETEFQRIIDNLNVLRRAFFTHSDTPITPPISFHYEDINSLEKILYDLDAMAEEIKNNYRICGTFQCGEE